MTSASQRDDIVGRLPLGAIDRVTFYKRDELTTDLICCDVVMGDKVSFFHEEGTEWSTLIAHLEKLQGFRHDWFSAVATPAFQTCETIAFAKDKGSAA